MDVGIANRTRLVRSIMLPSYATVRSLLEILPGTPKRAVRHMITAVYQETGTPQDQVHWNNPDKWIPERLADVDEEIAILIWKGSGKRVNPRYIYSSYLFINGFDLMLVDKNGVYQSTTRTKHFIDEDQSLLRSIDEAEGIYTILRAVGQFGDDRARLTEVWAKFLFTNSPFRSASSVRATLTDRLRNLIERKLIAGSGRAFRLTDSARAYLHAAPSQRQLT